MSLKCWLLRTMVFLTAKNISAWVLFLLSLSVWYCAAELCWGKGVVLMDLGWVRISPEESKENAWAGLKGSVLRMEKFNITSSQHMYTYISMCVCIYIHTLTSPPPESISKVKQSAEAWPLSVHHIFVLRSRCLKKHYLYYKAAEKKAW